MRIEKLVRDLHTAMYDLEFNEYANLSKNLRNRYSQLYSNLTNFLNQLDKERIKNENS